MGVFGAVVQAFVVAVFNARHDLTLDGAVAFELVG